jgi:alanine dehydrogenase
MVKYPDGTTETEAQATFRPATVDVKAERAQGHNVLVPARLSDAKKQTDNTYLLVGAVCVAGAAYFLL